jgi:hypothetical protein
VPYRFRPWQLAAALIAVCAILVSAVIWFRQGRRLTTPELLASLPDEKGVLLFINAGALRDAGVLDALLGKTVSEESDYRDFVAQTGFDYRTDLDQAVAKFTKDGAFMVVNGRFEWSQIMRYVVHAGGSCHNGFCRVQGSQLNRQISFYPLRRHVMALAVGESDSAALSIRPGTRNPDPANAPAYPVWLKAPVSIIRNSDKLPAGTRQFAKLLESADSVLMTLGNEPAGFVAGMQVDCKNAEDAAVLKTQLEDLTIMLRKVITQEGGKPNPADLSGVLTGGTFERRNNQVVGHWAVPRIFLDSLNSN